ncbi:hypothetical protein HDU88_000119 [Geranomyces variabilis]|nr:hypothetical protein HDU88_000119 [Geranomyces variabilis]
MPRTRSHDTQAEPSASSTPPASEKRKADGQDTWLRRSSRRRVSKAPSTPTPPPTRKKSVRVDKNSKEHLFTAKKSALVTCGEDVKKCFTPGVLAVFSPEEQAELASLLPAIDRTGAGMISPALFNSVHLRETLSKFQENLEEGLYDPNALEAMVEDVEMQKDKYEAWKDRHYEESWGDSFNTVS